MSFVAKRILASLLVVFGAVTLVFLILYWLPGDPALMIAGEDAADATVAQVRAQLGTDRPLGVQYMSYVGRLLRGDLGTSFVTREPVLRRLVAQFPATLSLTVAATSVAVIVGVLLGLAAALFHRRWADHIIQFLTLFFISMPSFWFGILLILIFAVGLRWLPSLGNGSFAQLILPAACLGLISAGSLARMVRSSVLDVRRDPFVLTLRAKGLSGARILFRHVLRSAIIPPLTLVGVLFGELLAGATIAETLFARQGLGRLVMEAIGQKDIPVVQGAVLFASTFYVLVNLLVDLSYGRIDPRIRGQA